MVSHRVFGFLDHRFEVLWEGFAWAAKSSRPNQGAKRRSSGKTTDHAAAALRLVRRTFISLQPISKVVLLQTSFCLGWQR
jgi:hypothetical protein